MIKKGDIVKVKKYVRFTGSKRAHYKVEIIADDILYLSRKGRKFPKYKAKVLIDQVERIK